MIILIIAAIVVVFFAFRFKFWRNVLFITFLVLVLTWVGAQITNTTFFKFYVYPESNVLDDFELIDFAFARQRPDPLIEQRISIVNIGNSTRAEIANQINVARKFGAKVIGVDAYFINGIDVDTTGSYLLSKAIREAGNVVLVCSLAGQRLDSVLYSEDEFMKFATAGYANLGTSGGSTVLRDFSPMYNSKASTLYSFSTQIVFKYDSAKAIELIERGNEYEKINFRGNIAGGLDDKVPAMYNTIDVDQFERGDFITDLLNGQIVLLGFMGDNLERFDITDHFITPINPEPYKKRLPDMYGIVVHANIISMILNQDYIMTLSYFGEIIFAFFICYIHVALLLLIYNKFHVWFDLLALIIIVFQLFIYSWLRLFLFNAFGISMELYVTLASLAIAGVAINIYNEVFPYIRRKIQKLTVRNGSN